MYVIMNKDYLNNFISCIPDYPKKGIIFRDITPLLADAAAFSYLIRYWVDQVNKMSVKPTVIAGAESRGFIFGVALAQALSIGFIPIRKKGKLPRKIFSINYDLEYGSDTLEMHQDAASASDNVLLIDDLLATGGTAKACIQLIEKTGANIVDFFFLLEIKSINGGDKIRPYSYQSILHI